MRSNISAQSCSSVPPAPALIETIASELSYSPDKSCSVLAVFNSFSRPTISFDISCKILISFSLTASSKRSFKSVTRLDLFRYFSFLSFKKLNSELIFPASLGSFQISGFASFSSSIFISDSSLFKSKQPP